jgi:hypothetical protein
MVRYQDIADGNSVRTSLTGFAVACPGYGPWRWLTLLNEDPTDTLGSRPGTLLTLRKRA